MPGDAILLDATVPGERVQWLEAGPMMPVALDPVTIDRRILALK